MFAAIHVDVLTTLLPAIALGGAAVYVLLPRPKPYPWWPGALLGGGGLLLTGATILRTGAFNPETFLFYVFSALAIVSGVLLVTQHNPARAALSFTFVILSTCGLFLLLAAPFLMAATIIIYAGAIIVTFLFVLMLAQQSGRSDADQRSREPLLATLTGFVLLGTLIYVLQLSYEKSDTVDTLDKVLDRVRKTAARSDLDEANQTALREYIYEPVKQAIEDRLKTHSLIPQELDTIKGAISGTFAEANNAEELKVALGELEAIVLQTRQRYGWLTPSHGKNVEPKDNSQAEKEKAEAKAAEERKVMSNLSGPRPNTPAADMRYDDQGRPQLPAENAAYLGRSLFTDYLLPVELGGFLLLVAVIGSIAIAHRTQGKPPAAERTA
jgi:NADH:ubiquinone oxidoreductase subunit 6 (subunit J)